MSRWKVELRPKEGTSRTRRGFLFLPKRIGAEVRWLETAEWVEVFKCGPELKDSVVYQPQLSINWWPTNWVDS